MIESYILEILASIITTAVGVVLVKNPVYSILSLVLTFVHTALVLILLDLEFFALILIVIYVGAIAILFLFIIMMLDTREFLKIRVTQNFSLIFNILLLLIFNSIYLYIYSLTFTSLIIIYIDDYIDWYSFLYTLTTLNIIGQLLYTSYFLNFLLSGLILFLALIGSILLTTKAKTDIYRQHTYEQISRKYKNNILIIS